MTLPRKSNSGRLKSRDRVTAVTSRMPVPAAKVDEGVASMQIYSTSRRRVRAEPMSPVGEMAWNAGVQAIRRQVQP